jgi:uncharacterized membrane-anchored protein
MVNRLTSKKSIRGYVGIHGRNEEKSHEMNRKINILFFVIEVLSGIGFGVAFAYFSPFSGKGHLEQSVISTFISIFLGAIIGIAMPGYFHCRKVGKQKSFFKAVGLGITGVVLFLVLYILQNFLTFDYLPHYVSSIALPVILPIIGGVIGFNYALRQRH